MYATTLLERTAPPIEIAPHVRVTWRSVLLRAAQIIRWNGHSAQHAFGDDGEVCPVVALVRASTALGVSKFDDTYHEAMRAIERNLGGEPIIAWNRRQTPESVIEMLELSARS